MVEAEGRVSGTTTATELRGAARPARLLELTAPPEAVFLRGELPRGPAVAIVGTREPSLEGVAFTRRLAAELAAAGVAVLSGGAKGIDTAAHEGALDVGGSTVVVAPAGFSRPFPEDNARLFERVVATGGAYLSLYPDHVPADQAIFFARNACLVALADAVIVSQLPARRSGAANAAKWARQLGRPLFIVPHSPWVTEGGGATRELRLGGRPLDRAKDMLKFLRTAGLHAVPLPAQGELWRAADAGPPDAVLLALRSGASQTAEIAALTGLSVATVQQRILTLALSGVLVPGPSGSLKLVTD